MQGRHTGGEHGGRMASRGNGTGQKSLEYMSLYSRLLESGITRALVDDSNHQLTGRQARSSCS